MLYAGRPEARFTPDDANLCLVPHKEAPTFVQMDHASLVKKVTGHLVYLMADDVDPALLLDLGKGRLAANHLFSSLLNRRPTLSERYSSSISFS